MKYRLLAEEPLQPHARHYPSRLNLQPVRLPTTLSDHALVLTAVQPPTLQL
jgi:hypothetical protein